MHEGDAQQARDAQAAMDSWLPTRSRPRPRPADSVSPAGISVDELAKLADLHLAGALSDEEFAAMKAKISPVRKAMCRPSSRSRLTHRLPRARAGVSQTGTGVPSRHDATGAFHRARLPARN
jgi:hypothetical protein